MASLDAIREAAEGQLDRILAKLDRRHRALLLGAVQTFGGLEFVPQSIWDEIRQDLENETAAALLAIIIASDGWTRDRIVHQGVAIRGPTPADVSRYGTVAAVQAQSLAADRLAGIQRRFADSLEEFQDARRAASEAFKASARERDVVTTTTDTMSLGQRGAGRAGDGASTADGQRVSVEMIWATERDARVCPICAPLDRTAENVWGRTQPNGPPAHPNCRCSLTPKVIVQSVERAA